ncbi:hypothetical protein HBE96_23135 [Clostridium sp. P21]|uniref:Uncharacterized protein n=1 Tax=Clostridium muellerianum TaxID=2716538 RepID=A0A7Y0HRR3_9CLOT|nr:hypothetical protein [Clostridium muellerianum]NMM65476.1 hypothetical protein [Clostridium muellerianum]
MQWASQLEEIQKVKAKERQALVGSQNLGLDVETLPPLEQGKTRDIVAKESKSFRNEKHGVVKYEVSLSATR